MLILSLACDFCNKSFQQLIHDKCPRIKKHYSIWIDGAIFVREALNTEMFLENSDQWCFIARSLSQNVPGNPGKLGRELLRMQSVPFWLQLFHTKRFFTENKQTSVYSRLWATDRNRHYLSRLVSFVQILFGFPQCEMKIEEISTQLVLLPPFLDYFNTQHTLQTAIKKPAIILVMETCIKLFHLNVRA